MSRLYRIVCPTPTRPNLNKTSLQASTDQCIVSAIVKGNLNACLELALMALREAVQNNRLLTSTAKTFLRSLGILAQSSACRKYLRSQTTRKLQIGCCTNLLPGWLNTDIYPQSRAVVFLDASKRFPLPDSSFDYVFSEHQLEHIPFADGAFMVKECFRILKPGAKIRVAVPSIDTLIDLFQSDRTKIQQALDTNVVDNYFPEACEYLASFPLNLAFINWGHMFMYDMATLKRILENAGFANVTSCPVSVSDDANLRGIEFRASALDKFKTLVLEASKPMIAAKAEDQSIDLVATG